MGWWKQSQAGPVRLPVVHSNTVVFHQFRGTSPAEWSSLKLQCLEAGGECAGFCGQATLTAQGASSVLGCDEEQGKGPDLF